MGVSLGITEQDIPLLDIRKRHRVKSNLGLSLIPINSNLLLISWFLRLVIVASVRTLSKDILLYRVSVDRLHVVVVADAFHEVVDADEDDVDELDVHC